MSKQDTSNSDLDELQPKYKLNYHKAKPNRFVNDSETTIAQYEDRIDQLAKQFMEMYKHRFGNIDNPTLLEIDSLSINIRDDLLDIFSSPINGTHRNQWYEYSLVTSSTEKFWQGTVTYWNDDPVAKTQQLQMLLTILNKLLQIAKFAT